MSEEDVRENTPLVSSDRRSSSEHHSVNVIQNVQKSSSLSGSKLYKEYLRPCAGELMGTMGYVLLGTAAYTADLTLAQGLVQGLTASVLITAFLSISGGNLNPAITLALLLSGGITPGLAFCYLISQVAGGILGAAFCRGILSTPVSLNDSTTIYESIRGGAHQLGPGVSVGTGVLTEAVLTYLMVTTFLMALYDTKGRTGSGPLMVGSTIIVSVIAAIEITGGSMNPARSLGPCVMVSDLNVPDVWKNHWVYWVGPFVGAIFAAIFYRLLFSSGDRRLIVKED